MASNPTYQIDAAGAARIGKVVRQVEHTPVDRTGGQDGPAQASVGFWAKLTAESSGTYQWTKQKITSGGFVDDTPTSGSLYSAKEQNGAKGLAAGTPIVFLKFSGYASGNPVYFFDAPPFGSTSSPKQLVGSGVNADTTTWSQATDKDAVNVLWSRTFWDTSTGTLYGYYRTGLTDSNGNLSSVTAETRYAVDTTQGCQGSNGSQGSQGSQGAQGAQGNQGNQGTQGAASTIAGPQGNQGSQGSQGSQGTAGTPASSQPYAPLTNGDPSAPAFIFNEFGGAIMAPLT